MVRRARGGIGTSGTTHAGPMHSESGFVSMGRTSEEPKARLGAVAGPSSLWVKHRVPPLNWAVGAVLGALTGTVCLVLLGIPAILESPSGVFGVAIWMGTYVGAPLGALGAPVLGWSVLRRVPAGRLIGLGRPQARKKPADVAIRRAFFRYAND